MRGVIGLFVRVCAMALAVVASAAAADTGTVSGAVFARDGKPVPDATVQISGGRLPLGRTTETSANGLYQFEYLLPGEYLVEVEKVPEGRSRRTAFVEIEKDTQVDLVIGLAVQEDVTVSAAIPVVDIRTASVSFNFTSATFNALPL
jgi:protocatechuate 3,4-dioxygenase beta subunit